MAVGQSLHSRTQYLACSGGLDRPYTHSDLSLLRMGKLAEGVEKRVCRWWEVAQKWSCYDSETMPMDLLQRGDRDHEPSSPWPRQQLRREKRVDKLSRMQSVVACACLEELLGLARLFGESARAHENIVILHGHVDSSHNHYSFLRIRICTTFGMRLGWVWCTRRAIRHNVKAPRRLLSTQATSQPDPLSKTTRNIGIIAHIDAVRTYIFKGKAQ